MASFSGTFTGTTSSSLIDVTAGTGTLAQLQADVDAADPGIFTVAGGDPYTYTILGNRELELSSGVTLNMQNKDDILQWTLSAAKYPILDIQSGSIFNIGDGTSTGDGQVVKGDSGGTQYSYIYIYGSLNLQGTLGNEVTIQDYRSIYFYTGPAATDFCDWDHVICKDVTLSSGYIWYWDGINCDNAQPHTFHNVTVSDVSGFGYLYFDRGCDFTNTIFDNITIDGIDRVYNFNTSVKFTNSTFKNIDTYAMLFYAGSMIRSVTHYDASPVEPFSNRWEQPKTTFDNCTFDSNYDSGTKYAIYGVTRGSLALFKDCTFQNAAYGVYVWGGGVALYAGTNTFNSITTADRQWGSNNPVHLHCRTLDLTVYDENGDYLNNARVNVRQKEGNETWDFITRSHTSSDPSDPSRPDHDGQISDMFGDFPVFVEKEETSTGVYVNWSNGGDQVHELTVSYPGYVTHHEELKFTSDLTVEVTLELETTPSTETKIYNSTLYNTTLY